MCSRHLSTTAARPASSTSTLQGPCFAEALEVLERGEDARGGQGGPQPRDLGVAGDVKRHVRISLISLNAKTVPTNSSSAEKPYRTRFSLANDVSLAPISTPGNDAECEEHASRTFDMTQAPVRDAAGDGEHGDGGQTRPDRLLDGIATEAHEHGNENEPSTKAEEAGVETCH